MSNFTSRFKQVPPVTLVIIVACIAIYFILPLIPNGIAIENSLAISPAALMTGHYETLVTSMFLHGSIMHLFCNMVSLYYLGVMCERIYGSLRFAIIYFASGIIGGLVFCGVNYAGGDIMASAVGASGAIFGLFGAYGWLLIKEHKVATLFVQPTSADDIKGYLAILLVNLAIGFAPGSNIANEAHIGGMIAGFVIGMSFYFTLPLIKLSRKNRAPRQKAEGTRKMPKFGQNANNRQSKPAQQQTSQAQPQVTPLQTSRPQQQSQPQQAPRTQPQGNAKPSGQIWQDEGRAGQYDPYHTRK